MAIGPSPNGNSPPGEPGLRGSRAPRALWPRLVTAIVFACGLAYLIFDMFNPGTPAEPSLFRLLIPGEVSAAGGNRNLLSGRFTVVVDPSPAAHPIAVEKRSYGSGGACLIADLAKLGVPEQACTQKPDCDSAWSRYHAANLGLPNYASNKFGEKYNGYCLQGRCWYRPGGQELCVRKPFSVGVWPLGSHSFGPMDVSHVTAFYGQAAEIDWQVLTCANRASEVTLKDDSSCAAGTGIYRP